MRLVLVVVEAAAGLADLTTLVVAPVLENEARHKEHVAGVRVDAAPPLAELLVIARIVDEVVDGVEDRIEALVVGEALEERAELLPRRLDGAVLKKGSISSRDMIRIRPNVHW